MKAMVVTYGDDRFVPHWQLIVDGRLIGDTSVRLDANLFYLIASTLNAATRIARSAPSVDRGASGSFKITDLYR